MHLRIVACCYGAIAADIQSQRHAAGSNLMCSTDDECKVYVLSHSPCAHKPGSSERAKLSLVWQI